jgi:hypothetical protein
MGRPTPETGGSTPNNGGLSEFKVLSEQKGVGPRAQKPIEANQQPADPNREAFERFLRSTPMRPAVIEGLPSSRPSRRHNGEGNQPTPQKPSEERGQQPVEEAGQKQPEPEYSQERIDEAKKIWPDEPLDMIIWRLKDEDRRKEDKRLGRRRGFGFS